MIMVIDSFLPRTDEEADERLIAVVSSYIIEKEMPLTFAKMILESNLRDKRGLAKFWFQILLITGKNVQRH